MSEPKAALVTLNPRYCLYARAHGRSAMGQMKHDDEAYPGGCMTGFILWLGERYREFWDWLGIPKHDPSPLQTPRDILAQLMTHNYFERFDQWLEKYVETTCLAAKR